MGRADARHRWPSFRPAISIAGICVCGPGLNAASTFADREESGRLAPMDQQDEDQILQGVVYRIADEYGCTVDEFNAVLDRHPIEVDRDKYLKRALAVQLLHLEQKSRRRDCTEVWTLGTAVDLDPPLRQQTRKSRCRERSQGVRRAIENRLLIRDEFVLRYKTDDADDGLPPGEGAFLPCSFWLLANYVLQGRYAQALQLFERLLARCNVVGLLAEEIDPVTGRMLDNLPQTYSHLGVNNCTLNLSRQVGPVEERAEPQALFHAPV